MTSGSPHAFSSGVSSSLFGKGAAVAFEDYERGRENGAARLHQLDEGVIHGLVGHAVHEEICACVHAGARGFEFGRVDRDAQFETMALRDHGLRDGEKFFHRAVGRDDVPDLDVIRAALGELLHQAHAGLGRLDLHDGRVAVQFELRSRHTGNQRTGDGEAWRFRDGAGELGQAEVRHRPADVDDGRNPATQVTRESVLQMIFNPRDLILVGTDAGEIDHVRPREEAARLEEMHMGIDVTGEKKFPRAINHARAGGQFFFLTRRDTGDGVALDHDDGARDDFPVARIDDGAAHES